MGKLVPLVLLVLLVGANYQEAQAFSFGNIFDIASIVKDVIGTIADVVGVFIPQKLAPDHSKKYKQFENDLLDQNNRLQESYEKTDDALNRTTLMEKKLGKNVKFFREINIQTINRDIQITDMMNRINDVVKRTDVLTYAITDLIVDQMKETATRLDIMDNFDTRMNELHRHIVDISSIFNELMNRVMSNEEMSIRRFRELLKSIVSFKPMYPNDVMHKIQKIFNPGESSNLYGSLLTYFVQYTDILEFNKKCDLDETFQDKLKSIFNVVMITEVRSFLMRVVSYKFAQIEDPIRNVNVKNDVNKFVKDLMVRSKDYIRIIKKAFEHTPTDIMRCDPPVHLKDNNAFEMNRLFTKYYINTAQIEKSCGLSCNNIDIRRELECVSAKKSRTEKIVPQYCPRFQCKGRLHDCSDLPYYSFCESRIPNERRYKWLLTNPSDTEISSCDGDFINTLTNVGCVNCFCQCSEEGAESEATRAISLLPQISDYKRNMVVTNIRFQKKDNVVHVQIEQGELLPEGRITRGSQHWVPLKDLVYTKNTPDGSFSMVEGNDLVPLIPNVNFTFLNWENRKVMLHDVKVNDNYVVTGVRFQFKDKAAGEDWHSRKIFIEVHSTKFDYFTGKLLWEDKDAHEWVNIMTAKNHNGWRSDLLEINLEGFDDPMKSGRNEVISGSNQFVLFRASSKSDGQVTIPYWDARPAGVASRTALSGIGIAHRGSSGYGGFIAPKLLGLDHSYAMTFELSDEKLRSYQWN